MTFTAFQSTHFSAMRKKKLYIKRNRKYIPIYAISTFIAVITADF